MALSRNHKLSFCVLSALLITIPATLQLVLNPFAHSSPSLSLNTHSSHYVDKPFKTSLSSLILSNSESQPPEPSLAPLNSFPNTSLTPKTPSLLDLPIDTDLDLTQSKATVTDLIRESTKQTQLLDLENKIQTELNTHLTTLKNTKSDFTTATQKISTYRSTTRFKRSAELASIDPFTLDSPDKTALQTFLKSYIEIQTTQASLNQELQSITGTSSRSSRGRRSTTETPSPAMPQSPSWEEIQQSSQDMGLLGSDLKLFGGQYGIDRYDAPGNVWNWKHIECPSRDRNCGWGDWDTNPYRLFFANREGWKAALQKITKPQQELFNLVSDPKWVTCGLFLYVFGEWGRQQCGSLQREKLEQEIRQAKSEFRFTIWSKYLQWMNKM